MEQQFDHRVYSGLQHHVYRITHDCFLRVGYVSMLIQLASTFYLMPAIVPPQYDADGWENHKADELARMHQHAEGPSAQRTREM